MNEYMMCPNVYHIKFPRITIVAVIPSGEVNL